MVVVVGFVVVAVAVAVGVVDVVVAAVGGVFAFFDTLEAKTL